VRFARRFEHRKKFVLALILAVLLSFCAHELLFQKSSVPGASAVETGANIGVYWDVICTQLVSSINWGNMTPGDTREAVVYVRNEGNQTLALNLTSMNWTPANASQWLTFSWNYSNNLIEAGKVLTVNPTLHVASPFGGGFSSFAFDILFGGQEILPTYNVTINAYCETEAAGVPVAVAEDGSSTGFNTTYTFTGLTGTHIFTVPSADANGHPFKNWNTGQTTTTITVSSAGNYTAYYQAALPSNYTVSFLETKLPSQAQWWVDLKGDNQSSTSNVINFSLPNGTYTYSTGASGYTPSASKGLVTVNGTNTNEQVTFSARPIIPEFPSLIVLLPFMIATLLAVIIYRKKSMRTRQD